MKSAGLGSGNVAATERATGRLPIVAVFGSGDDEHGNGWLAEEVGRRIAAAGCHLLTGGGRGVMADACRGFVSVPERRGLSIAILPSADGVHPRAGYPNPWVEVPILTQLTGEGGPESPSSRNRINVLTASRVIVLPGRSGTLAELRLAHRQGKPTLVVQQAAGRRGEAEFNRAVKAMRLVPCLLSRQADAATWAALEAFLSAASRG